MANLLDLSRTPLTDKYHVFSPRRVYWNLPTAWLFEEAIRRSEGVAAHGGALVVHTGPHTGRSPDDRFVVREPSSEGEVDWGKVNHPFDPGRFEQLHKRMMASLEDCDLFVQDCYAGADPEYRLPLRIITETAWQSLFASHMFIKASPASIQTHQPEFTVVSAPFFKADPARDGTHSEAFIILNLAEKMVLIGGTRYAGEIKKSIFSVLNYLLPLRGVLSMHASANIGADGQSAVFFGLSGTGKTTLSADPHRVLIGDDEHGWSNHGVFNFEGGCYAKMIRLSAEAEPQIFEATRRFGTVLENVKVNLETREVDLNDDSITENTRGAYPLDYIPNASRTGLGDHPSDLVMLMADAFGVMPPIAKLTPDQAMYHFLSGYTAKVAGTERGVTEPQATFSTCFGAPFMVLAPGVYARLLGDRLNSRKTRVWLLNTGWTGGPHGLGRRMKIAHSRAMLGAALGGKLDDVSYRLDPVFGLEVPRICPDVPEELLEPRRTWRDPKGYDQKAAQLAALFAANFRQYEGTAGQRVREAGPRV
ncbi:MAG: phosphoenolpyruvate carboxykinase (ATP) [Candidatus Riflebacteria bacterium]|nr:phosphoenolpyruvate carboxykinase (ATP) [Candidatus Riflebacteria bacterium]